MMWRALALLSAGLSGLVWAEPSQGPQDASERELADWKMISDTLLTPDGQWFTYAIGPSMGVDVARGNVVVVTRNLKSDVERRYEAGDAASGGGGLRMSPSGKWIAFRQAPPTDDVERLKDSKQAVQTRIVVLEVSSGRKVAEYPGVRDFAFLGGARERILLHATPSKEGDTSSPLTVEAIGGAREQAVDDVISYALDAGQSRVALATSKSLQLFDAASGKTSVLDSGEWPYSTLTWSRTGRALAALREHGEKQAAIVAVTGVGSNRSRTKVFDPVGWKDFPTDHRILNGPSFRIVTMIPPLAWRDDDAGVFFTIRPNETPPMMPAGTASNLILWHSADAYLPSQKKLSRRWPRADLSFVSLADGRFVRLADDRLPEVVAQPRGRYALGNDPEPYNLPHAPNLTGTTRTVQFRDYYLVNLQSGARMQIMKKLPVLLSRGISAAPQLSPDGRFVLYQNAGDYFSYEVSSGRHRNLTAGLPTQFYWPENFRNERMFRDMEWLTDVLQGWSNDGRYAVVSDYFDLWALPLSGGRATPLTGDGRKKNMVYEVADIRGMDGTLAQDEVRRVDLSKPFHLRMVEYHTGRNGLARWAPGKGSVQALRWDAAALSFYEAASADVRILYRLPSVGSANYDVVDSSWQSVKSITDANPQEGQNLPPASRYLTFKTANGAVLHAALHLPVGYIEGRAYPTIVSIYERQAFMYYGMSSPGNDVYYWQQRGYAVLRPDIQARVNEAGKAALEAVTAAVDAAVATGIVDRNRLGLTGHSNGGFETYYIVTQTQMFKAAVPQAGWTNALSDYGSIYDRDGSPRSHGAEHEQPYLAGPWWEHWDAFVRNSPLYHARDIRTPLLIQHGNSDKLVPFAQAVEMFNNLRRMGNRQVVLLEYEGIDHSFHIGGDTERDVRLRMLEFFDHFVKGDAPAPRWWAEGTSYLQGQAPAPVAR